jgi:hypothetical protein
MREAGVISEVFYGKEDHGILTCSVRVNFDGSTQSFGGIAFESCKIADDFVADLCRTFAVEKLDELRGLACVAYRCFPYNNEPIEALEALSGARFTLTGWRRKHWPLDALDPREARRANLRREEKRLRGRLTEIRASLDRVDADYEPVPEDQ